MWPWGRARLCRGWGGARIVEVLHCSWFLGYLLIPLREYLLAGGKQAKESFRGAPFGLLFPLTAVAPPSGLKRVRPEFGLELPLFPWRPHREKLTC